ncbi:MAG: hypothetical protein KGY50_04770 [Candidatus Thermoplasmatota archaeon]|nr:hypothetical protein [Candidatus Thermoplasmatota archaeon]
MQTRSIYKVPDGKLIKIFLKYKKHPDLIESINIAGDFFAYPEESIQQLEQTLIGKPIKKTKLEQLITDFVDAHNVQFIGISPQSLTEAVMRCPL